MYRRNTYKFATFGWCLVISVIFALTYMLIPRVLIIQGMNNAFTAFLPLWDMFACLGLLLALVAEVGMVRSLLLQFVDLFRKH